jgi:hypothetical protein
MPLVYKPNENLLRSRAQVLVNNVNCVGVMGKGLARSFAEAYGDDIMRDYVRLCITKALRFGLDEVQPGQEFTNSQRIGQELIDVAADLLTTPRQALYTALRRNTN